MGRRHPKPADRPRIEPKGCPSELALAMYKCYDNGEQREVIILDVCLFALLCWTARV